MSLRELGIDIDLDVEFIEIIEAQRHVDELVDSVRDLDRTYRIDIDLNASSAKQSIHDLEMQLQRLDNSNININTDVSGATNEISHIRTQIEAIDNHTIDIDIDTAAAHAQLVALQAHASSISGNNPLPQPGPSMPQLPNPGKLAGMFNMGSIIKFGVIITSIIMFAPLLASTLMVLVGVIGTLGVAIGVLAGGLLALASAATVAAMGIGGFAAIGITTIMELYDENAKLTAEQKALKVQTDSVVKSWNDLKKALQGTTFGAIGSGVSVINTLLGRAEPILKNATVAVDGLFDSLEQSISGTNMTNFFNYLERSIGPLTTNIGNGLGYALQGVLNTMVALEPLTNWMAQGFENMMGRFADWTAGLSDSSKMQAFMDYVKAELPKIGDIFKGLTDGIVGFFAAFDVTASEGLGWMAEKMKDFAKWAGDLDNNQGFQDMLNTIKTDGPLIAKILGNIAKGIKDITTEFANFGRNEDGSSPMLNFLSKGNEIGQFGLDALKPGGIFRAAFKFGDDNKDDGPGVISKFFSSFKMPTLEFKFNANTEEIEQEVENLTAKERDLPLLVTPTLDPFASRLNLPAQTFDVEVNAKTDNFNTEIQNLTSTEKQIQVPVVPSVETAAIGPVNVPVRVTSLETYGLAPLKVPIQMPSNETFGFKWPPYPIFTWPQLPKFEWPALPRFTWPPYPRFTWPPMPTVRVSVNGTPSNVPGFSSGLGRVPYDMPAIVHQDEAILQGGNAQFLRDAGVLQGDGRNPYIDTNAMADYGATAVSTTTTSNTSSQSNVIHVGGIEVIVQGGQTNGETGSAVEDAIENTFAKLGVVMFAAREG